VDENEELKKALVGYGPTELRNYEPRQATENWQEFLLRNAPLGFSGLMTALSAIPGFRGPFMRGPAQAQRLNLQDFVTAQKLRNVEQGDPMIFPSEPGMRPARYPLQYPEAFAKAPKIRND